MRLQLVGNFELIGDDGRDCAPRGAKARAVVALLARTPDHRRTRRWLEARLWSDRAAEQASGSLRQALVEIRKALGPHADALWSDRESVAMIGLRTDLDDDPTSAQEALQEGREFLEGIDVADQAFEDWLREERARLTPNRTANLRPAGLLYGPMPVNIWLGRLPDGIGNFVGMALADAIGRLIGEFADVEIFTEPAGSARVSLPERGLTLGVESAMIGGKLHVLAVLASLSNRQVLWSRRAALAVEDANLIAEGEFPQLVFQAAEAAHNMAPAGQGVRGAQWASARTAAALREMYSFDGSRLREADRILADVLTHFPTARTYAWRAHLRQIMGIERTERDRIRMMAEADEYSRRALEMQDVNPLVLALVSQVRVMLDGDPEAGTALARDAIALSPYNAFSHAAMAGAMLRMGDVAGAIENAQRGASIAALSPHSFWWQALLGLTYVAGGKFDKATACYEAAHVRATKFRSPMRHLYFLYAAAGKYEKAERMLESLRRIEPDFSFDLVKHDPTYPASTLRRMRLVA